MSRVANFLQGAGIASQAGDVFDRARRVDRVAEQAEQRQLLADDRDFLRYEIFKRAYDEDEAEAAAAAAAPAAGPAVLPAGAVTLPSMPVAPGFHADDANDQFLGAAAAEERRRRLTRRSPDMDRRADGGLIGGEKFNGIYDDMKIVEGERMPTIFNEWARDTKTMMVPGGMERMLNDLGSSMREHAMANGGTVPSSATTNDVYTPANFANGGMIGGFMRQFMPKPAAVKIKGKKQEAVKKRDGGAVRGAGTGTSDSVPATGPGGRPFALSDGEYVLSADTVRAVGKDNLDALQSRYHTKV